jgi:hypothetical protein
MGPSSISLSCFFCNNGTWYHCWSTFLWNNDLVSHKCKNDLRYSNGVRSHLWKNDQRRNNDLASHLCNNHQRYMPWRTALECQCPHSKEHTSPVLYGTLSGWVIVGTTAFHVLLAGGRQTLAWFTSQKKKYSPRETASTHTAVIAQPTYIT